jgi:hypothetical protein
MDADLSVSYDAKPILEPDLRPRVQAEQVARDVTRIRVEGLTNRSAAAACGDMIAAATAARHH